jgi:membrane-associated protein
MDAFFSYICEHAHHAPWIMFSLLLLTGLSLPISEDIILLGGGAIASTCIPDHTLRMYTWLFLGSFLAAWEAYWIGRLLGPQLYHIRYFKSVVTPYRLEVLRHYYAKFGIFTFIVGRFCPGGIRNALFMSSGLTKMPFYLFILRDGLACLISTLTLFFIGYKFGQHLDLMIDYFHRYTHWFFIILACLLSIGLLYFWYYHSSQHKKNHD